MAEETFTCNRRNLAVGLVCFLGIVLTFNVQPSRQQAYHRNTFSVLSSPKRTSSADRGYNIYDYTALPSNKLAYNTSFAVTVPLFSFTLPRKNVPLANPNLGFFESIITQIDPLNQIVYGLIAFGLTGLLTVIARFFIEKDPPTTYKNSYYRSLNSDSPFGSFGNMILDSVINSANDASDKSVANWLGLNWKNCLQKSICKANHSPKQFGILSLPFQVIFKSSSPKWSNSTIKSSTVDFPFSKSYVNAAKYGKRATAKCSERYNCFIDFFDMTEYIAAFVQSKFGTSEE